MANVALVFVVLIVLGFGTGIIALVLDYMMNRRQRSNI